MDLNLELHLGNDQVVEVDEAEDDEDDQDLAGHGVICFMLNNFILIRLGGKM